MNRVCATAHGRINLSRCLYFILFFFHTFNIFFTFKIVLHVSMFTENIAFPPPPSAVKRTRHEAACVCRSYGITTFQRDAGTTVVPAPCYSTRFDLLTARLQPPCSTFEQTPSSVVSKTLPSLISPRPPAHSPSCRVSSI